MKNIKLKNLFTMIELILVIAIIAFLTVTATVVLSQWLSKSRDSRRMADIAQIEKGVETAFIENNEYPLPDSYVNITASGTLFNYQGKFCDTATEKSNIKATPKDPSDNACYTYETTTGQNKFQLMAFMENTDSKIGFNENAILAVDYTKRTPAVKGDKLGILVASGTNQPVEDTGTGVDIVNTNNEYIAYISEKKIAYGTGKSLIFIKDGGGKSCDDILSKYPNYKNKDGLYYINPTGTGSFEVYCDMTSDDGGWTLILSIAGDGGNNPNARLLFSGGSEGFGTGPIIKASTGAVLGRSIVEKMSYKYIRTYVNNSTGYILGAFPSQKNIPYKLFKYPNTNKYWLRDGKDTYYSNHWLSLAGYDAYYTGLSLIDADRPNFWMVAGYYDGTRCMVRTTAIFPDYSCDNTSLTDFYYVWIK